MKLDDRGHTSDAALKVILINADMATYNVVLTILDARDQDLDVLAVARTKPVWGHGHPWSEWFFITEHELYNYCKRGLNDDETLIEINVYSRLIVKKESLLDSWL